MSTTTPKPTASNETPDKAIQVEKLTKLPEMAPLARAVAYLSPLTYIQDLMNHAVLRAGLLPPWLDLIPLLVSGLLFLLVSMRMHERSRRLGY
jgi:ABC-type polysaccharide/polyol phosphate export permease